MSQTPRQFPVPPRTVLPPFRPSVPDPMPAGSAPKAPAGLSDVPRLRPVPPVEYDDDGYPCADGAPMAENDGQLQQMVYAISALQGHYRHRPDVFVTGDVFINYLEGDRAAMVAPDVYVAFGADPGKRRRSYKLWEDPVPSFVMEVLSDSTKGRDLRTKHDLYRLMGVSEYWLYDPDGEWIAGHLWGYRLTADGEYERISPLAGGRHRSEVLGLLLWDEGGDLRLHDPVTGRDLQRVEEAYTALDAAETARDAAEAAREAAEERTAREAAAREAAEAQAAREVAAREAAEAQAAREVAAREAAEARVAALEALLREHSSPPERSE